MRTPRLVVAAALAATLGVAPLAAHAANAPASRALPTAPGVADVVAAASSVAVVGTLVTDGDLSPADITGAASCHPGWKTVHASITYNDITGQPAYTWHHNVTFHYTCSKVDSATHTSGVTIYQPIYSFGGYLVNTLTGVGTATVHADAQGRVGICTHVGIDGCLLERDPGIVWVLTATGAAKAHLEDA